MLNILSKDTSPFKNSFLTRLVLSAILIFFTLVFNQSYVTASIGNMRQLKTYQSEAAWLGSFNYTAAQQAKAQFWKPMNAAAISGIVSNRINIFKDAGLDIKNIHQQQPKKPVKGKKLKTIGYSITVAGSWEQLVPVLNKFEMDNTILITDISISYKSKDLTADIKFNVNHI